MQNQALITIFNPKLLKSHNLSNFREVLMAINIYMLYF